jgi:hypothetical protein
LYISQDVQVGLVFAVRQSRRSKSRTYPEKVACHT